MVMGLGANPLNLTGQVTMVIPGGQQAALQFPQVLNASGAVVGTLTPAHARISVEGAPVRWGLNPSNGSGQFIGTTPPTNVLILEDPNSNFSGLLRQVKFFAIGGDSTLQINYLD